MKKDMFTVSEVREMILKGKQLVLAGDEKLLAQLPAGKWIAGTIPYFMSAEGGKYSLDKIFVDELPPYVSATEVKRYDRHSIRNVYSDGPENGFSIIIAPAFSDVYTSFVLEVHTYENFAAKPLVGWVSGTSLDNPDHNSPKVFDGTVACGFANEAVVFHVELPRDKKVEIDIINIFKPGSGDVIEFMEDGLSASDILVNGQKTNFADYIAHNKIDVRLPIVTDLYGATINTSFKEVDEKNKTVHFFAPVFKGMKYTLAVSVGDYVESFNRQLPTEHQDKIFFSCNCILNYLYAELEGKKTGVVTGPITFGEIAYQFLNQTLVYLMIDNAG